MSAAEVFENGCTGNGNNSMEDSKNNSLQHYLSPLHVWALSFGCAVGWGAFVMPGTTFLPIAGPVGTAIGMGIGAALMVFIGMNYSYMMKEYPNAGGAYAYVKKQFGYDHGFLCAWFLILVYVAVLWANMTAIALVGRNILGTVFQFGFHYNVLGYDVYFGEVIIELVFLLVFGAICISSKKIAVILQSVFAIMLIGGIVVSFFIIKNSADVDVWAFSPGFAQADTLPIAQLFGIVVLAPWAFVGFESVSHSSEEYDFKKSKPMIVMIAAIITAAISYILLCFIAVSVLPEGYDGWISYINDLPSLSGRESLPVFYAVETVMGKKGTVLLAVTLLSGVLTGMIGNFIASSRLIYAVAKDNILPKWFGELDHHSNPRNAEIFLVATSAAIPLLGRAAIGWVVDMTTIGATIVYAYVSLSAFKLARDRNDNTQRCIALVGFIASAVFFVYFMMFSQGALAAESFLILAVWSILGFLFFRHTFKADDKRRFGHSTVVWIGLLFLVFFTTLMWVKQSTDEMSNRLAKSVQTYYEGIMPDLTGEHRIESERHIDKELADADRILVRNSFIQMLLIMASLGVMISVYKIMSDREKRMEVEKHKAEENSIAKSAFLSNMSHDIRTPMNAIIGYISLAKEEGVTFEQTKEYMSKIESSSHHLLALINDILEMSRIESGRVELEDGPVNLKKVMDDVEDMFATQMQNKNITYTVDYSKVRDLHVIFDKNRFNRVLLNLISNAYKFTPEEGAVSVIMEQGENVTEDRGDFILRVKDSGIGMTEEFAEKVFEAFERERTSTVSGIQGTGLGMAITKNIVDMMGGYIDVNTAVGEGTEFIVHLPITIDYEYVKKEKEKSSESEQELDYANIRLLVVEDMDINREIAVMMLTQTGFMTDTAVNGKEAFEKVRDNEAGYYDAVLMDVQMPVMNGYDATKAIRELKDQDKASVPVIAMTANAFTEDVKDAMDAGMNGHIAKPIDINNILEELKKVIKKG